MAFGLQKLAVLESKLGIYEDLSKEMLDKLERAVDKISESNQNVALILERHENRLDQVDRSEAALLELIKGINNKLEKLERKVEDLSKFRWITMGVVAASALVIGSSTFFGNLLTLGSNGSTLGGANTTLSK